MESDYGKELRLLREQMASDFNWTAISFGHMDERMNGLSDRITEVANRVTEVANRVTELAGEVKHVADEFSMFSRDARGRFRSIEERFDRFLAIVEGDVADVHTSLRDHEERLQKLERGGSPAA